MPEVITEPPPDTGLDSPGGGGWVSQHKGVVIGGVLGLGVLVFLYARSKQSSANNASTSSPSVYELAPGTSLTGNGSATGGGSYVSSAIAALEQQIAGLSQQVSALPGPSGTTTGSGSSIAGGTGANSGSVPIPLIEVSKSGAVYDFGNGIPNPGVVNPSDPIVASFQDPGAQYWGGTNPGGGLPGNPGFFGGGASPTPIVSAYPTAGGGYTLVNQGGQTYNFGSGPGEFSGG